MATAVKVEQVPAEIAMKFVTDDDMTWTAFFEEELTPNVWTPITITGTSPQAMIKRREKDDEILEEWALTPDTPSAGYLVLSLNDVETKALGTGTFYTSIRLTRGGYTRTYMAGSVEIQRRSTYD